jgi:hypothetical protein
MRHAVLGAVWSLACVVPLLARSPYRELVAPDTEQRDLKGAVEEVREKTYKIDEQGKRVLVQEKIVRFDRAGYQFVELTVEVTTSGRSTEHRMYDADLNWVRQETNDGLKLEVRLLKTDPAKNQVTWRTSDPSGRSTVTKVVTYGASRKPAEGREFDAQGRVTQSYRVTRDARGLGMEVVFMDPKGRVKYRSVPAWDERGIMIGSVDEFMENQSTAVRKFEPVAVDQAGNWTELRKSTRFVEKDGEHPGPVEAVIRVIQYHQ